MRRSDPRTAAPAEGTAGSERDRPSARLKRTVLGDRAIRRLTVVHGIDDFSGALVNLSLVGSLFFSVSLDASRSRIVLYLLLTAAPLAVATPLIGPLVERLRAGYRVIIVGTQLARAALVLGLVGSLLSLGLYPLVFGILLGRKVYAISRIAVLGQLVDDPVRLVGAAGHLSRVATVAGGLGTGLGGLLLVVAGPRHLLFVAAAGHLTAAVAGLRLPVASAPDASGTVPDHDGEDPGATVPADPYGDVRVATLPVATTRAAAGALTFLLAYALKQGGGDAWLYGAGLVGGGVGAFAGSLVAPRLHEPFTYPQRLGLALLVPGVVALAGSLAVGSASIIAIAFAMGLGQAVASRTIDGLYARVPALHRGRVIARNELRFQLANVFGALLPVLFPMPPRLGLAIVAIVLLGGGFVFGARQRVSLRHEAGRLLLGGARRRELPLSYALLRDAEHHARAGAGAMSVSLADAAVRVARSRAADTERAAGLEHQARAAHAVGAELATVEAMWADVGASVAAIAAADVEPTADEVRRVLAAATALVEALTPPPISPA